MNDNHSLLNMTLIEERIFLKESYVVQYEKLIKQLRNDFNETHIISNQIINLAHENEVKCYTTYNILNNQQEKESCNSSEDKNCLNDQLCVPYNNNYLNSDCHSNIKLFTSSSSSHKNDINKESSCEDNQLSNSFQISQNYIKSNESESLLKRKRSLSNENEVDLVNTIINNFEEIALNIINFKNKLEEVKSKYSIRYSNKKVRQLKNEEKVKPIKQIKRSKYMMMSTEQKNSIVEYSKVHGIQNTINKYKISIKNLKRWLKFGPERRKGGGRKKANPVMESKLFEWYNLHYKSNELPISIKLLKQMAIRFANTANFAASRGWLSRFINKYNILIGKHKV